MFKEKIQELLEILNLSEEEQRKKIAVYLNPPPWKHDFVAGPNPGDHERCIKCKRRLETKYDYDEECPYTYSYTGSLADLAFKLRNGVICSPIISLGFWQEAKQKVFEKYKGGFCCEQALSTFGKIHLWFVNVAQPIHWIVAGLIAKMLSGEIQNGSRF